MRFRNHHQGISSIVVALLLGLTGPEGRAADVPWSNDTGSNNRWVLPSHWIGGSLPATTDQSIFSTGKAAILTVTNTSTGAAIGVGTIEINTPRNQNQSASASGYFAFNASTDGNSSAVSTISYGNSAGFTLQMSSVEGGYQGNAFYVGADRNTGTISGSGQIVSNISNEFAVRVKQGQRLNYYSTVKGTGSITLDSVVSSGDLLGELTLGFGRGPSESQDALALNDFANGVTVRKAQLNLSENSLFNGSGTMTSSSAGLGSILFTTGGAAISGNARLSGF